MTSLSHDDRGVALLWALALVSVVGLAGTVASVVAMQAVVHQRAAAVADVAALAAAQASADPCSRADQVVRDNAMVLTACSTAGGDVTLAVAAPAAPIVVRVLALIGRPIEEVRAQARAG